MGIVVIGAVFVDIKGYPESSYIPAGRNVGRVEQIHGGVGRNVAEDVANELSKRIGNDGHLVNGVISKIKTYTELMGERVDMDVAARLLGDVLNKNKTPLMMVKSMCEKMCVSYDEICGTSRELRLLLMLRAELPALQLLQEHKC